ncbi:MAG: hypothetical protein JSR26_06290 [Proteobacteria bacterium]|nr:hypothetical protein [Pseudomonadota bacterium]
MSKRSFLAELKRRNVLRAAALYTGATWALAQGISQLSPAVGLPDWATRWFLVAAIIGFPFAMVLSWFYEWTPHGIVRESEVAADTSVTRQTGRTMDRWIIAVLCVCVALLLADILVPHRTQTTSAGAPAKSIAVLPFLNMSGDPKNDYFSDGITEEILNALAQARDLKVAARTSAFAFKGRNEDLRAIGRELDVATVLEGSVQTSGNQVRITAQLIDTRSGYHLWSEKYDRKLTDVFAIEDEISAAIAARLQAQLRAGTHAADTDDVKAHEFYLRGLSLLAARGPGMRDAVVAFRQATMIDPNYAQAWAGLARAEALVANWHLDDDNEAYARAADAAQRALKIDPDVAAAYVALGILHDDHWQWEQAGQAFGRALELAPGDAETIDQHAQFLLMTGQVQAALPEIERANALDPKSGIIGSVHAEILLSLHRCDDAQAQIARTMSVAPDMRHAQGIDFVVALTCKRRDGIEDLARRLASNLGEDPSLFEALARGVFDPSQRAAAVQRIRAYQPLQGRPNWNKAHWLSLLGDRDGALSALEAVVAKGPVGGSELLWAPGFDPIRGDPRFQRVLERVGVPFPATPGTKP